MMSSFEGSERPSKKGGHERVSVHQPVLLEQTLGALGLEPGMTVVDGTIGAGGHAEAVMMAISPGGTLVGLDRDAEILARAKERLADGATVSEARAGVRFYHLSSSRMLEALSDIGRTSCDRVLLDLGVSSLQLDTPRRGFSFMHDGPLDMRMDQKQGRTVGQWLARVSERELVGVLKEYGEERYSRRIACRILDARADGRLNSTADLAEIVRRAVPPSARHRRRHPATRTFLALRILVNDELGELQRALQAALRCLAPGGRLVVIAFHSLEDRIVKRFIRDHMQRGNPKPIMAESEEIARNPRARSAKLRWAVKRVA